MKDRSLCLSVFFLVGVLLIACQSATPEVVTQKVVEIETPVETVKQDTEEKEVRTRIVIDGVSVTGDDKGVTTVYKNFPPDPVLKEIYEQNEQEEEDREQVTEDIRARQKAEKKQRRKEKLYLSSELPPSARPSSLDEFEMVPHLPPVPQYMTGTCWSFASTSLMEAEVLRMQGKKIKLAEMHTVYYEYLAKGGRFIGERSKSEFGEGSQGNAISRIFKDHGAMTWEAYPGVLEDEDRHNHVFMFDELDGLLRHYDDFELWDEQTQRGMFKVVLNKQLGTPPSTFSYGGVDHTPTSFLKDVLKVNPDDYVDFMSTMKVPFYSKGVFDTVDNWWNFDGYHNLPLEGFYEAMKEAIKAGYSVVVAIDVSEPGKNSATDTMFIPAYDIPSANIDQLSREHRMNNSSTTDDHAINVVGYARIGDRDWFLAKDSGRGARKGKFEGYYFIRDDYVRLKVMTFTVHKDGAPEALTKF